MQDNAKIPCISPLFAHLLASLSAGALKNSPLDWRALNELLFNETFR